MRAHARLLQLTALAALTLTACPENPPVPTGPVCRTGCLASQECVAEDRCACKQGFLDCDGLDENGCEVTGAACPQQCKPESDIAFCARAAKNCGTYTAEDNCGDIRSVNCGSCLLPATCGGSGKENVCGQPAACESDPAFCLRHGKDCGEFTGVDDCDQPRTADCGSCVDPETCGGGGNSNQCGEPACESDPAFCQRKGKNCGRYSGTDDCGQPRTAECGTCTDPESCGGAGVDNVCGQQAVCEDDAAFCARSGKDCDSFSDTDNCGQPRTAVCGACTDPESCGGGGEDNVCGCTGIEDFEYCMNQGFDCGQSDFTDECGVQRTAWCGGCGTGWDCTANVCVPRILEDESCVSNGMVLDCPIPMACITNGASGADKVGVCKRKCASDSQCRVGETCTLGQLGNPLEGVCAVPATEGEACASLFGSPNFCWDANEPAGAMLDCLGSVCRYICTWDGRLDAPLPCPTGSRCGSTQTTYPEYPMWISVCEAGEACTPESDAEFCVRLQVDCGEWSGLDNCENGRTVANCGVCDFGDCIGGSCM